MEKLRYIGNTFPYSFYKFVKAYPMGKVKLQNLFKDEFDPATALRNITSLSKLPKVMIRINQETSPKVLQ